MNDLTLSPMLLRFSTAVRARFERETGDERCEHLGRSFVVGLLFYNAYDVSDFLLMRDVAWYSTIARLLVITPAALVLIRLLPRFPASVREFLVTMAMVAVVLVPTGCLAVSTSPYAGYTFAEMPLVLVFAGMMLVLSVGWNTFFTAFTALLTIAAIMAQPAFDGVVRYAMLLQLATACAFVLYANRRIELVHRASYLKTLSEKLRAEVLEETTVALANLSMIDPLSGLANRRRLDEVLGSHEKKGSRVALVLLDVDHFKAFNDEYGHQRGDACIKAVGGALVSATGPEDLVARYGGEEFVVVTRDPDEASLSATIERLRAAVSRLGIRHAARTDGKDFLTVSAGGAMALMEPGKAKELIARADEALYAAKKAGRDRYKLAA